jgi:hypothetical protein
MATGRCIPHHDLCPKVSSNVPGDRDGADRVWIDAYYAQHLLQSVAGQLGWDPLRGPWNWPLLPKHREKGSRKTKGHHLGLHRI